MARHLALAFLLAALSGCASDKPLEFACPRIDDFRTALPVTPLGSARIEENDPLTRRLGDAFAGSGTERRRTSDQPPSLLILSGGGQWGAYGAGLLKGWSSQSAPNTRPTFDVVTGVSTGATQATFAFLGRDAPLVAAYSIKDEKELVTRHGDLFFLSHGSSADLAPLRARIEELATPEVLKAVADADPNRLLYVGAVDALDGRMYAIDLTAIARDPGLTAAERRTCYTGAIVASAAIPLVFRQVTIGGTPYYDGGVRSSVFVAGLQTAAARALKARGVAEGRGDVYILFNGVPGVTPKEAVKPALLPTLGRLKSITFDQIDQDSIFAAYVTAQKEHATNTYTATARGHGCPPAKDGVIFDPALMACLIDRGEKVWDQGSPWKPYPKGP
jgi:predicted acylesterase/phospholipase RssA